MDKNNKKEITKNILASIGLMTIGGILTSIIFFSILNSSTYGFFGVMKYIEGLEKNVSSFYGLMKVVENIEELKNTEITKETDFEREINLQRAMERLIIVSIESLEDIYQVYITVAWSNNNFPETIITITIEPIQGIDINNDNQLIDSIYNITKVVIRDIKNENIIIRDWNGTILNN